MVFSLARRGRAGIINLIPIALAGLLAQLLSFFAEGAALWKLVVLYGWTWWGVLAYLFIFTLSGIYFVIEYVSYLKEYGIPLMRSYFRQSKTSKSNGVVRK
jgi:hypothetical protein